MRQAPALQMVLHQRFSSAILPPAMPTTRLRVCAESELAAGTGRRVLVQPGWEIGVFRTREGALHAIDNACPHAGAPLHNGPIVGGDVVCPLHLWSFSLTTGKCTLFEGPEVEVYPIEVDAGYIYVLLEEEDADE
ncbi:(2Fe-2S)-binding protein [Verrucomicrobia bacterium LW23]|nr:(2Fe-2S)-binding protein [Verrucomicrobia bacterium LW23]